ncbi:MAG TPA: hypothetical protein PK812_11125 [Beijerinckiaceae bacterium]|nr:hypothetical protein [Beijerinckiaceae bacterium]
MRAKSIALVLAVCAAAGTAEARPMPGPTVTFGPNCHAISRATGQSSLFVGTVLGGRTTGHRWGDGTMMDYRTFQGCFVTEAACTAWAARHASRYPGAPAYSRCTPVYVGLRPRG